MKEIKRPNSEKAQPVFPVTVKELQRLLLTLMEEVEKLKAENLELKARLNNNSGNSSQPPSSDWYRKQPALPKKSKGKKGGTVGHKGRTLRQLEKPDKIVICKAEECSCGHLLKDLSGSIVEKRQVFDLPKPRLEVTEYQIVKTICPSCGKEQKGKAPENVRAPVQYGTGVKAFAVMLNNGYKIPFKKIQLLFTDMFGYPINESTVYRANQICYEKLEESEQIIKSKVVQSKTVHADETGIRVAGKLAWLHTATTENYTYLFTHQKRGKEALNSSKSVISNINGWLVHDCWSSYFAYTNLKHATCGAHILRELQGLVENNNTKWAKVFKSFLLNLYQMPIEKRIEQKQVILSRFDSICNIAQKAEPPPKRVSQRGRAKRTKGRNLLERLIKYKSAVLAFAFNQEVPFTNNLAERDIRPAKIKQKISNCFRTFNGSEIYARIEGFISTARKNNQNIFFELSNAFENKTFLVDDYEAPK
jgi:transposase